MPRDPIFLCVSFSQYCVTKSTFFSSLYAADYVVIVLYFLLIMVRHIFTLTSQCQLRRWLDLDLRKLFWKATGLLAARRSNRGSVAGFFLASRWYFSKHLGDIFRDIFPSILVTFFWTFSWIQEKTLFVWTHPINLLAVFSNLIFQLRFCWRNMHWIPVGASLFASNIGSEHFIGITYRVSPNNYFHIIFLHTKCIYWTK